MNRQTNQRPICTKCGQRIRDFRITRDWDSRDMHKRCWKEHQDMLDFLEQYNIWKRQQEEAEELKKRYSY